MEETSRDMLGLAEKLETARCEFDISAEDNARVVGAFGIHQVRYDRAGWKYICPDNGRPCGALWPIRSLDDLSTLYRMSERVGRGGAMPATIPSNPLKACAAALRARASSSNDAGSV